MEGKHAPFRYDYVGSFLRPAELKQARSDYKAGKISKEDLRATEDKCIIDLVNKQKAEGYHVITDGEFRRSWWHMDFFWGLNGIDYVQTKDGLHFHGETTKAESAVVTGKISGEHHPFVEYYKFVKALEDAHTIAKQTIPAPAQLLAQLRLPEFAKENKAVYPDEDVLKVEPFLLITRLFRNSTKQDAAACSLMTVPGLYMRIVPCGNTSVLTTKS